MKRFILLILLASLASASACSWDILNNDMSTDSWYLGYPQYFYLNHCDSYCSKTSANGTVILTCNRPNDDGTQNCNYNLNTTAASNMNLTSEIRYRFKFNSTMANNGTALRLDAPFSIAAGIHENSSYLYRYSIFQNNPLIDVELASASTFSDWHSFWIQMLNSSHARYKFDGSSWSSPYAYNSTLKYSTSNYSVELYGYGTPLIPFRNVSLEVDYLRISSDNSCSECTVNADCSLGYRCENNSCLAGECASDSDCFSLYGAGYYCNSNSTCTYQAWGCSDDGDCSSGEYCNLYRSASYRQCVSKKNVGEACTHDNMCLDSTCLGGTPTVTSCDAYSQYLDSDCDYPTQRCELDSYCWTYGTCYNLSQMCAYDSNCTGTEYCGTVTEGVGLSTCKDKQVMATDICVRDTWCDNSTSNLYGESMDCLEGYCSPVSWACNWYRDGCGSGTSCNWSSVTQVGDHQCVTAVLTGGNCSLDSDCDYPSERCLAGSCQLNTTECLYNNPDKNGNPNPNNPINGYCGGIIANTSSQWCYVDQLNFTQTGGAVPVLPSKVCYNKFSVGVNCDYDYECLSGYCDYSGMSKVCKSRVGQNQSVQGNASLTATLSGCAWVDNRYECAYGGGGVVWAYYRSGGVLIEDAVCKAYSSAFVGGTKTLTAGTSAYIAPVRFISNGSASSSFEVECSASSYPTLLSGAVQVSMVSSNTSYVDWITPDDAASYSAGDTASFRVRYRTSTDTSISGATCTLTLDGDDYSMQTVSSGVYEKTNVVLPSTSGHYDYEVECSKSGYSTASSEQSLTVLANHCKNGKKDADENGVDCGGDDCEACEPPPNANDCFNHVLDSCEDGVDCGGCCSKECAQSNCRNGIQDGREAGVDCGGSCPFPCSAGSCTDRVMNGDELGTDCGGRCVEELGVLLGACACDYSNDCAPFDGSYYCNFSYSDVSGFCIKSECTSNSDCPSILWKEGGLPSYRARVCDDGVCRFGEGEQNGTTKTLTISITALSGLPPYNGSIYVGNCFDKTNGLKVTTNLASEKRYYFLQSPQGNSVPADNTSLYFPYKSFADGKNELVSSGVINETCGLISGDRIYARIVLQAQDKVSSAFNVRVVDLLVFRKPFTVNITRLSSGTVANFSLNRNGSCFARTEDAGVYANISSGEYTSYAYDISGISGRRFWWVCNNTFGESVSGSYNNGVWGSTKDIFKGIFQGATGSELRWYNWMWVLVWMMLIVIPLVYLVMRDSRYGKT